MQNNEHHLRLIRSCMAAPISMHLQRQIEIPEDGHCRLSIPFQSQFTQNSGFLHGALLFEVADTAGFIAANSVEPEFSVLTVDFNINFIRPVSKGSVIASARVIHKGKSVIICNASVTNETGNLVAEGRGTYMISSIRLMDNADYASF